MLQRSIWSDVPSLISIEGSDFRRQISPVKYRCFLNLALAVASRCIFGRAP
jgi:hypothetical protein